VSSTLNTLDFFISPGPPSLEVAEKLERVLQFMPKAPEIKNAYREYIDGLKQFSPTQWEEEVLNHYRQLRQMYSTLWLELGQINQYKGWPLKKFASEHLLKQWRLDGDFEKQAADWKKLIISFFENIISGESGLTFWSRQLSGTFTNQPEKTLAAIKFIFSIFGGDFLVKQADKAIKILHDRFLSSLEFRAAVAFAEKLYKLGLDRSEQRFEEAWARLKPKTMARLKGLDLAIPEPHEIDEHNQKTWIEEEAIARETIYKEVLKRSLESPFQLIEDVMRGTLAASLVKAVENDIYDLIRHLKADKRGFNRTDRSVDVDDADNETIMKALFPVSPKEPSDELIEKEFWKTVLERLTKIQKRIALMLIQGCPKGEIARTFDRSPAWVTDQINKIREKIILPK
jgi:DNA-binding NarL/FixJ family response regulator